MFHFNLFPYCKFFAILFIFIFFQGCSSKYGPVKGQNCVQDHVINVGWDGNFFEIPSKDELANAVPIDSHAGYERMKDCLGGNEDQCDKQKNEEKKAFKNILADLKKFVAEKPAGNNKQKHVLLFFHGGLNGRKAALERAIEHTLSMKEDSDTEVYPIFINWRSGFWTTLKDNYFRIRNGNIDDNRFRSTLTAPIHIVGDFAKTIGNAPITWWKEGEHSIISTWQRDIDESGQHIFGFTEKYLDQDTTNYPGRIILTKDDDSINVKRKALWAMTSWAKIISTPLVFTFGSPAWDSMKRRIHTMFITPKDLIIPETTNPQKINNNPAGTGATLKFLRQFNDEIKKLNGDYIGNPKIEVTLMGHSMGGIVLNHVLEFIPNMDVRNIVFMASADNLHNYRQTVFPFVQRRVSAKKKIDVYNLHLHPENEDLELSAKGFGPAGSLLVWIDHFYDSPEYTLQRTAGRWENLRRIRELIPNDINQKFHFKIFGRSPSKSYPKPKKRDRYDYVTCENSETKTVKHSKSDDAGMNMYHLGPQKHGDFDNVEFKYWRKSYWE